jgi:UDP-N-acetylmuramoyl-tripeptide--D-alanyl-D-alanine ligase
VHLELLGTVEAVAAAKAELVAALAPGSTAIVPADEPLLEPHLREDVRTIRFGDGGDVRLVRSDPEEVEIDLLGRRVTLEVKFTQEHLRRNLLAAVAAADAVGVVADGPIGFAPAPGRGRHVSLPHGITLIDDCYNANPMSMRAALDHLSAVRGSERSARRVAVLGDMLELGPEERAYHVQVGEHASELGIELLITVGPLAVAMAERFDGEVHCVADAGEAAAIVPDLLGEGDVVLVKGSRAVGLELVCSALRAEVPA